MAESLGGKFQPAFDPAGFTAELEFPIAQ
jgi:hypothetical protein